MLSFEDPYLALCLYGCLISSLCPSLSRGNPPPKTFQQCSVRVLPNRSPRIRGPPARSSPSGSQPQISTRRLGNPRPATLGTREPGALGTLRAQPSGAAWTAELPTAMQTQGPPVLPAWLSSAGPGAVGSVLLSCPALRAASPAERGPQPGSSTLWTPLPSPPPADRPQGWGFPVLSPPPTPTPHVCPPLPRPPLCMCHCAPFPPTYLPAVPEGAH